jgi:hypothetical protein
VEPGPRGEALRVRSPGSPREVRGPQWRGSPTVTNKQLIGHSSRGTGLIPAFPIQARITCVLGNVDRLLRPPSTPTDAERGEPQSVWTLKEVSLLFLIFFLIVHERDRLRDPLSPGWIIFIQFNFGIKITKVMIHEFIGILEAI